MKPGTACLLLLLLTACVVRAQDATPTEPAPAASTTVAADSTATTVTTTTVATQTETASTTPVATPAAVAVVADVPTVPAAPVVIAAPPTATASVAAVASTPAPSVLVAAQEIKKAVVAQCVSFKPGFCPRDYSPVCGFLTNGTSITFANNCTACSFTDLVAFVEGVCQSSKTTVPPVIPTSPAPSTPDDSQPTVERFSLVPPPSPGTPYVGTSTEAAANGVSPSVFVPLTVTCPDNQSRYLAVCTREYRPVCAVHLNLTKKTYSSPCSACLYGSVAYYRTTPCTATEVKESSAPATTCQRDILPFCRLNYSPVCAYAIDGSKRTQSNGCLACIDKKIIAYRNGECSTSGGRAKNRV